MLTMGSKAVRSDNTGNGGKVMVPVGLVIFSKFSSIIVSKGSDLVT